MNSLILHRPKSAVARMPQQTRSRSVMLTREGNRSSVSSGQMLAPTTHASTAAPRLLHSTTTSTQKLAQKSMQRPCESARAFLSTNQLVLPPSSKTAFPSRASSKSLSSLSSRSFSSLSSKSLSSLSSRSFSSFSSKLLTPSLSQRIISLSTQTTNTQFSIFATHQQTRPFAKKKNAFKEQLQQQLKDMKEGKLVLEEAKEQTPEEVLDDLGKKASGRNVFHMRRVTKMVEDRVLFKDVSISFFRGAKIGLLGLNGVGKSSLMKLIAGIDTSFDGELSLSSGVTVGYLPQEPELDPLKTVRENIYDGVTRHKEFYDEYLKLKEQRDQMDPTNSEFAELNDKVERMEHVVFELELNQLEVKISRAINALNCPPGESGVNHLSGGERRRVALCRLLLSAPDVLLLDEPTNHLDAGSIAWLERFLSEYSGTVIAITHDRYFLENLTSWILEIDNQRCYPFKGNYSQFLENKAKRIEIEQRKEKALKRQLEAELQWIRNAPKGGTKKSKSRVKAYETMYEQANALQRSFAPGQIVIPHGPKITSDHALHIKNLTLKMDDRVLLEGLNLSVPKNAVIGVVGPNGAGKTTLLRAINGELKPDQGEILFPPSVKMAYIGQIRTEELDPDNIVWREIADGQHVVTVGDNAIPVRQYVSMFAFKAGSQDKLVRDLSGGERNRVQLAKQLKIGANVLLIDEPTNDLDVDVLRNLEESLLEFPGCCIVVSHDRWFLNKICTHILALERPENPEEKGSWHFFEGNYQEYEQDRKERLGKDYRDPADIKYVKIKHV